MKPLESQINLRVVNNTALPQPVSILGIVPNSNTANNNNLLYEYDLIGQSFVGIISANLVIDTVVTFNPIGYSVVVYSQSFQGLVDALNSLNKGIFSYYGTTIYVTSDYYIYGKLTI